MEKGKNFNAVEKAVLDYISGCGTSKEVADAAEISEKELEESRILQDYDSYFNHLEGERDGLSEIQMEADEIKFFNCVLRILGLKYTDSGYVYVVREFDKEQGICTPCEIFASASDIMVNYCHKGDLSDEFSNRNDTDSLLDYIAFGYCSIIKVTPLPIEGELFELIGLNQNETPKYYHVIKKIVNKAR